MNRLLRTNLWPALVSIGAWIAAIATGAVCLVLGGLAARDSGTSGVFPQVVLGIPILEGFRDGDKFGVHLQWGVVLLVLLPLVITVASSILGIRRFTSRSGDDA